MAAVAHLDDPFARISLTLLRGTGLRLGELLDLELGCIWNSASHGSWLKIPLGKLGTERTVPLDTTTLAVLDEWMTLRGPQRALPHPRHGRLPTSCSPNAAAACPPTGSATGSMTRLRQQACAAGIASRCT